MYKPNTEGKYPVNDTPTAKINSDTIARRCSRTINNTHTAVNAKKPGISRKLCNMPISFPVKSAASLLKLLINAIHVEKMSGIKNAISNKKTKGVRQFFDVFIFNDSATDNYADGYTSLQAGRQLVIHKHGILSVFLKIALTIKWY